MTDHELAGLLADRPLAKSSKSSGPAVMAISVRNRWGLGHLVLGKVP